MYIGGHFLFHFMELFVTCLSSFPYLCRELVLVHLDRNMDKFNLLVYVHLHVYIYVRKINKSELDLLFLLCACDQNWPSQLIELHNDQ